ncbi:MAG: hypothetical protein M1840_006435 [Geoglossum simile]|nr:MAG: hypothetical protein M1840_006435 [Geoglossum simile]
MAPPVKDSFADLERHRMRLGKYVSELQNTLKHWQTWAAEYEGLKEEIIAFKGDPQPEDLIAIGRDFGGTVVTEKEIKELLGGGQNAQRSAPQVMNMISRRIEYVEKNVKTAETQLHTTQDKLNSILVISKPGILNEEGLPMMEIREELDDEGNVISSSTITPSDSTPQMIEILRKAGVTGLGDTGRIEATSIKKFENSTPEASQPNGQPSAPKNIVVAPKNSPRSTHAVANPCREPPHQKSVAPVEGEKICQQQSPNLRTPENAPCSPTIPSQGADSIRFANINRSEKEHKSPIVPTDDSPEDAALRREMLQYAFSEVGAVVAELELEESSQSSSDEDEDDETQGTSSAEEEDKFGRATGRVVDDKYRKEMEVLERKLRTRMKNIGPRLGVPSLDDATLESRQPSLVDNGLASGPLDEPKKRAKKEVRFAEELDISPSPQTNTTDAVHETIKLQPPLEESVFERGLTADAPSGPEPPKTGKVSKFKNSRASSALAVKPYSNPSTLQRSTNNGQTLANGQSKEEVIERGVPGMNPSLLLAPATAKKNKSQFSSPIVLPEETEIVPKDPPGKILSDNIIERSVSRSTEPPDPDGLDPALLHQEIAMKYHHMRNCMIQREGGFMPREEELERVPLTEEEGGSGKKVSRFKAARIGKKAGI